MGLSVIIPVAKGDQTWRSLLPDLVHLDLDDEIIFVAPEDRTSDLHAENQKHKRTVPCRWIISAMGRAKQLNLGAQTATKDHLWFLHCDSRIAESGIRKLKNSIIKNSDSILFFNLKFLNDGPAWIIANELGTWIRSRILRLPFGDQGFCMSRKIYFQLNGFDEAATYGEDHLLIWKAHQTRVPIKCIPEALKTSSRKYKEQGWSHTTAKHLILTIRQAVPELLRLLQIRSVK